MYIPELSREFVTILLSWHLPRWGILRYGMMLPRCGPVSANPFFCSRGSIKVCSLSCLWGQQFLFLLLKILLFTNKKLLYKQQQISMFLIALIGLLGLTLYFYFYIKPKREIQAYRKYFEAAGYKPYIWCFHPLQIFTMQIFSEGAKRGDIFQFYKKDLQGYDVVIGCYFNRVAFQFLKPQLIQQFCDHDRDGHYQKEKKIKEITTIFMGQGLLNSEGQVWKKKRKILNQIFNFNFISSQSNHIIASCEEAFKQVLQKKSFDDETYVFSIKHFALTFASTFIFNSFLGGHLKDQKIKGLRPDQMLKELIDTGMNYYTDILLLMFSPRVLQLGFREKDRKYTAEINLFDNWAQDFTRSRIKEEEKKIEQLGSRYVATDILSALALANYKSPSDKPYSYKDIVSELKTFFAAGTETTSSLIMSMIYFVYTNPSVMAKVKEQVDFSVRDKIQFENIKHMQYLEAVLKETLRLVGPTSGIMPRKVRQNHLLGGVKIHKGASVSYSVASHYSDQNFAKPLDFRPERWLNGQCNHLHPYIPMIFHGGPKACIGKHTSLLQAKIVLIIFMLKFKEVKILSDKMQIEISATIWPKQYQISVKT